MPTSGENAIHEIQADLACPQCQYHLRDLRGEVINCPECGTVCDVAKLIMLRWDTRKPWEAPLSGILWIPVVWAVLSVLVMGNIAARQTNQWYARHSPWSIPPLVWPWIALGGIMVIWLALLWYVCKRFGSFQGAHLALLRHLVFVSFFAGAFAGLACAAIVIWILIGVVQAVLGDTGMLRHVWKPAVVYGVPSAVVTFALMYFVDRVERYIARQCIRRFLARTADPNQPPPTAS